MKYQIDQSIIDQTTKCHVDLKCIKSLKCNGYKMCELDFSVGNNTYFVKCPPLLKCNYRINFGDGHICNCPVRKEFFRKYNI